MILIIGSAIAMCLSINVSIQYHSLAANGDPGRIAAQVISGIGFLGAGAIFRYGANVKGLTTAASLWTTAIIGLAVGAGYTFLGIVATIVVLMVLAALDLFEKRVMIGSVTRTIVIHGVDRPGLLEEIEGFLNAFRIPIKSIGVSKDFEKNLIEVETIAKVLLDQDLDRIIREVEKIDGIKTFKVQ